TRSGGELMLLGLFPIGPGLGVFVPVAARALLGLIVRHARGANGAGAVDEDIRLVRLGEVTRSAEDAGNTREIDVGDATAAERDRWRGKRRGSRIADVTLARAGRSRRADTTTPLDVDAADVDGGGARGTERVLVGDLVDVSGGADG